MQGRYGNIVDLEERAFNILVDLSMINLHSNPANMTLQSNEDN